MTIVVIASKRLKRNAQEPPQDWPPSSAPSGVSIADGRWEHFTYFTRMLLILEACSCISCNLLQWIPGPLTEINQLESWGLRFLQSMVHWETHTHTRVHTALLGELVKWWNASSFCGSLSTYRSSSAVSCNIHPLFFSSTLSLSLSYSSLSLSPALADSPSRSEFCKLLQLIESQWCENMALWQKAWRMSGL